jgi:hypothetical protein
MLNRGFVHFAGLLAAYSITVIVLPEPATAFIFMLLPELTIMLVSCEIYGFTIIHQPSFGLKGVNPLKEQYRVDPSKSNLLLHLLF